MNSSRRTSLRRSGRKTRSISPAVLAGLVDGPVEVELDLGPGAGEPAQAFQRDLRLPQVHGRVGAVVRVAAVLRDLHGRAVAPRAAHPNAGGVLTAVAEGRPATRADPLAAAVVAFGLLGESLEIFRISSSPERISSAARSSSVSSLKFFGSFSHSSSSSETENWPSTPWKTLGEDTVEGVEVGLALHEARAREVVERQQRRAVLTLLEGRHQHHPFLHRNRDAYFAQP